MSVEVPDQEQAAVTDQELQMSYLVGVGDNTEAFNEALTVATDQELPELLAVYFMRPHYQGGAPMTPSRLTPEEEPLLHERIVSADPETVQDPLSKQILQGMQAQLANQGPEDYKNDDPMSPNSVDQKLLCLSLVPEMIKKYPPSTSKEMVTLAAMELGQPSSSKGANAPNAFNTYRQLHLAVIDKAAEPISIKPEDDYNDARSRRAHDNLSLVLDAKSQLRANADNFEGADPAVAKQLAAELKLAEENILRQDFALEGRQLEAAKALVSNGATTYHLGRNYELFTKFIDSTSEPDVQQLLIGDIKSGDKQLDQEIIERYRTAAIDNITNGIDQTTPSVYLGAVKRILEDPDFKRIDAVEPDSLKLTLFLMDEDPEQVYRSIKQTLSDPTVIKIEQNLATTNGEANPVWTELAKIIIEGSRGDNRIGSAIDQIGKTPRLQRLIDEPSLALPKFLKVISQRIESPALLIAAGSGVIAENYAQASKLSDYSQIEHYISRVRDFCSSIQTVTFNEEVSKLYADFLQGKEDAPAADQAAAARLFSALTMIGPEDIKEVGSLAELQSTIVSGLVAELTGDKEVALTQEEQTKLLESFGGNITPLITYVQKFIGREGYRVNLAELTVSVADGSYREWHSGDGSEQSLHEMVDAGYLPEQLTLDQYQEWITDRTGSSREELLASAEDTAKAIREAVELASLDMSMLTPGYEMRLEEIPDVVAQRNGLGKLLGMVNRTAKAGEQPLLPEELDSIVAGMGEDASLQEVQKFIGILGEGSLPKDVRGFIVSKREQLEQTRLITRLANITAEEVVAGALLKTDSKDSKSRSQEQIADILDELGDNLPPEMRFIPNQIVELLKDYADESRAQGQTEELIVEDTIDPKVTLEIGETPQKSCQHYATGSFNQGLIGYFGPEVKISIVRNSRGGIIARSITRLMQDEDGQPVIYTEPVYKAVASQKIDELLQQHINQKAEAMGIPVMGSLFAKSTGRKTLTVRKLKMPAVYSDAGRGLNSDSLTIVA